jgi:hypothetical protein
MTRKLDVCCPHCGMKSIFPLETRLPVKVKVLCGNCREDITEEIKRAFLREAALGISGNLVERENREFFEFLEQAWQEQEGEDSTGREDGD